MSEKQGQEGDTREDITVPETMDQRPYGEGNIDALTLLLYMKILF